MTTPDFLNGGGETGALMRAHEWRGSPLGEAAAWPQPLKTLVAVMLCAGQPMFILWGRERSLLYNDSYADILGSKHPDALGRPFLDVWSEIRVELTPIVEEAYAGNPVHMADIELLMHRHGYPEETHFAFSYTPVRDGHGQIGGIFCPCVETTGQVFTERRLAAETERQRRLFERAPGFITVLRGPDHVFEFVNDAYRHLFGHRAYIGNSVEDVFPELEGQGFYELLDKVYTSGERVVARQLPIRLKPSSTDEMADYFLDFIYAPITDEAGRVTGIFCEGHDVTEAHIAQQELRASEERYRSLFTSLDAGFCVVEVKFDDDMNPVDYRFVETNPAFARQTGLIDADGCWARELVPDLEPFWVEAYGRVALTREPARFESGSDAMGRWFDVHTFPVGEPESRRVAILFNDISARRQAEQAVHELNETLEQRVAERTAERDRAWRNSRDLLLVLDTQGFYRAVSPAWERVLGWTPEELAGSHYAELIHPEDREMTAEAFAASIRGEMPRSENRYRHKDGSYRIIDWVAAPEGALIYASGRDVTAEKKQMVALEQTQEALRQAQKMEAMGQLTGGVAHDFNNLLTPIIAVLDMLQRRAVGGEREQRLIGSALGAADRAKTLVQRLLAFARRQPLQPAPVEVGGLVKGMADLIASTTGPQITVVVDIDSDMAPALADANQLEMAILNLAVNARDAMPEGGTLTLSVAEETVGAGHRTKLKPGDYIQLCVVDTGIGMDEATRSRSIDPFFSTKGIGKGTGLGLSMVHGLVAQLNGALTIASTPGFGTRVDLWLPVSTKLPKGAEPANVEIGAARAGTVLLVDDEAAVRATTADMLTELGYDIIEVASGQEALARLEGGLDFDLLITDHLMPGISGMDLARTVRARWPGRPVLVVSGFAEAEGMAPDLPFLTKPFRQADLAASLAGLASEP